MESSVQSRIDTLLRDLREGTIEQRQHAAQVLRDCGAVAVEPLCLALRDKDLNVRVAAAESLGQVGDERAVQALIEALKMCFVRRVARWIRPIRLVVLLACIILLVAAPIGGDSYVTKVTSLVIIIAITWTYVVRYYSQIRSQGKVCQAIVEALTYIAERNPTPELRAALLDLKAIAADGQQQDIHTQSAARQAAQRIETLTEQLKSLPLPAAAPAPDAATLPRAVDAPEQETERLPRVTVSE